MPFKPQWKIRVQSSVQVAELPIRTGLLCLPMYFFLFFSILASQTSPISQVDVNSGVSHDDQSLSRAIEASLSYNQAVDSYDELPLEERVRKGDW